MKTVAEIAKALDGLEYGREFPPADIVRQACEAEIVICYGASDDLVELDGALGDEAGGPGTVYLGLDGFLGCRCDNYRCPYEKERKEKAPKIKAVWNDKDGPSWTFETSIPHEKFKLMEDSDVFCVGIVFSVDAIKEASGS